MKTKLNLRRGAALGLADLVLVALAAAADAKPKPEVIPKAGDYSGDPMSGRFTTAVRASGTISARTVVEPGVEGSPACKTGNVKFKLYRGR